jgi:hypothetical protein
MGGLSDEERLASFIYVRVFNSKVRTGEHQEDQLKEHCYKRCI